VEVVEEAALVEERGLGGVRYLAGVSALMARPPKAMTRPRTSQIGNITRSRKRS
jgi:hypothetical protein